MEIKKESAAGTWRNTATPSYKVIRIIPRKQRKRKSRGHIIAVKAITLGAALMAIYGALLIETNTVAGLVIFGLAFPYLAAFCIANGGIQRD